MKPPTRAISPRSRDDAVARIRSLTAATAVAGIVGTGAFGTLAAINYSGTASANGSTTDATNSTVDQSTTRNDRSEHSSSGSAGSGFQAAPPAVSSTHRKHVTSGGS